jgi:hypothetical protein
MSPRASPPPTTLHGHWLLFARVAWVVVAITALAIVVFSVPSSFEHYSSVCTAASEVCSSERTVDQPTPEGVRALRDAGLSVRTYALLNVIVDKVFQLVWFVVGVLIFWRRSDDRMALLVSMFLVSFGPVSVDTTDAEALISSQPAWWLPSGPWTSWVMSAPCCSSCFSPADGSCRAGRAGSRFRSALFKLAIFSFESFTLLRPP